MKHEEEPDKTKNMKQNPNIVTDSHALSGTVGDIKFSSAWWILLNMKSSFLQQAKKKKNKLRWSRTEQWRHFSFTIDLFLLHPKLLRVLDDRNITLLFVSYLLLKAKSSQRNFKWALQPFMVLKTPGREWKACISWLQATSTSTLDLHFLFKKKIILKRGFCHSWMLCFHLSQSAATNSVNETVLHKSGGNMWAAAGSLDSERGRSKNLKKGQFVKEETTDLHCGFDHTRRNVSLSCWQGFVCMCCRWTHPCFVWIW